MNMQSTLSFSFLCVCLKKVFDANMILIGGGGGGGVALERRFDVEKDSELIGKFIIWKM